MANVQHENIDKPEDIHEPKQVAGADTSQAGEIITPSSGNNGIGVIRKLLMSELDGDSTAVGSVAESDGSNSVNVVAPQYLYALEDAVNNLSHWTIDTSVSTISASLSNNNNDLDVTFGVSGVYEVLHHWEVDDGTGATEYSTFNNQLLSVTSNDTKTFTKQDIHKERIIIKRIGA